MWRYHFYKEVTLDFGASFVLSFKNVDLSKTYRYIGHVYFSIAFLELRLYNNPT